MRFRHITSLRTGILATIAAFALIATSLVEANPASALAPVAQTSPSLVTVAGAAGAGPSSAGAAGAADEKESAADHARSLTPPATYEYSQGLWGIARHTAKFETSATPTSPVAPRSELFAAGTTASSASGLASIRGKVVSPPSVPVAGSFVYAVSAAGEYWTKTESNGTYILSNLPAGTYTLYFDGKVTVVVKNVTARENRLGVNATLALQAQIRGRVVDSSGSPISNATVKLHSVSDEYSTITWVLTDSSGNYYLHGIPAGRYKLLYSAEYSSGSYLEEWSGNTSGFSSAQITTLTTAQQLTASDVALATGSEIRGVVSGPGQVPLAGVSVSLTPANDEYGSFVWATTNAAGEFSLRGFGAGSYRINYDTSGVTSGSFASTWAGGASRFDQSTRYVIGDAVVEDVTQTLQSAGAITGKVSAAQVSGIARVQVSAYSLSSPYDSVAWASTDSAGNYRLSGLPTGQYKIHFDVAQVTSGSYLSQWSAGKTTFAQADVVSVTAGSTTTGRNASLAKAASISGVVKTSTGAAVSGASISVVSASNEYDYVADGYTLSNGTYVVRSLPAGSYKLYFSYFGHSATSLSPTWYAGKSSWSSATVVTVTAAQAKTGINVSMAKLGLISGKVTNASGDGLSDVDVIAYRQGDGGEETYGATTGGDGTYYLTALPVGSYKIHVSGAHVAEASYADTWFGGSTSSSATIVSLTTSVLSKTGINASLSNPAVLVKGTITSGGEPINNAHVRFYPVQGDQLGDPLTGYTDARGNYSVRAMPTGTYKIEFDAEYVNTGSFVSKWFGGSDEGSASLVNYPNAQTYLLNASLDPASHIEGVVVDETGLAVAGARVKVFSASDPYLQLHEELTDARGEFKISGVVPGNYKVFIDSSYTHVGHYLSEWHGTEFGVAPGLSTDIQVTAPQTYMLQPTVLEAAASLSGVLENGLGQPVAGVWVYLFSASDLSFSVASTLTDAKGLFALYDLPPGDYKLLMDVSEVSTASYRDTWYNLKETAATAGTLSLAHREQKTNVDLEIFTGAIITGKVTSKTTGKPLAGVQIHAYDSNGQLSRSAVTNALGVYTLRSLVSGRYGLIFDGSEIAGGPYVPIWAGDKATLQESTLVKVASIQTRTVNQALTIGATIRGTVTRDGTNQPVEGATVFVYSKTDVTKYLGLSAITAADGTYTLKGVPVGQVKLYIAGGNAVQPSVDEWYANKDSHALADAITLTTGQVRTLVDFQLSELVWTSVTGVVKLNGALTSNISVSLVDVQSNDIFLTTTTNNDGRFAFENIDPGQYRLLIQPGTVCYGDVYYPGQSGLAATVYEVQGRNTNDVGEFDNIPYNCQA